MIKTMLSISLSLLPSLVFAQSIDGVGGVFKPRSNIIYFTDRAVADDEATVLARPSPDLGRLIMQGTMITAVLETAINSDMAGTIRARIIEDIYSHDGRNALIPKGSQMLGSYTENSNVVQSRVGVVWRSVILPDGLRIKLNQINGSDRLGTSGLTGNTNNHLASKLTSASLITALGILPTVAAVNSTSNEFTQEAIIESGTNTQTIVGNTITPFLSRPATITIAQGKVVNALVQFDILLPTGYINGFN